eukprot:m.200072 g.200072  ORF g.200072 m.200072 type:complete len:72 (-) comp15328_c0_seq1:12-227(-)
MDNFTFHFANLDSLYILYRVCGFAWIACSKFCLSQRLVERDDSCSAWDVCVCVVSQLFTVSSTNLLFPRHP